jgi:hypothetical protein
MITLHRTGPMLYAVAHGLEPNLLRQSVDQSVDRLSVTEASRILRHYAGRHP